MEVTLAFKGGELQVIDENLKIVGLKVSVLGRASEEIVRLLHVLWNWESFSVLATLAPWRAILTPRNALVGIFAKTN